MKEYIIESDRRKIESSHINFNLSDNEAIKRYDNENENNELRLNKYPASDLLPIDKLTKNNVADNKTSKVIHGADDSWITLRFNIKYNDMEFTISKDRIINLFKYIDAINKASIEALLEQRSIFDSEFN